METKVEYMVIVPIYQASSTAPPLSTPIIDLSPPKPVSTSAQEPIFTATTATTTTTLPLPPPPQQQSITESLLASHVSALEQDLPQKIDETVHEAVKEAVQIALQPPLKECFKDLSEADMKEILHDRIVESGSYRSQPKHVALYKALEASMKHDKRDGFLAEKDKEAPSSSSKQKSIPHSEQPVNEVPIPDDVNVLDLEDTDTAHLPKIKNRLDWLKLMEECHLLLTDQIDLVNLKGNQLMPGVGKPLPLRGSQERRNALSISKLKAAYYLDFGLEELVSSLWIESEHEYDISAAYGITHYLKTYERYGYTILKEISLHKADYYNYKISEADFKNLHPNNFEDLYLLRLQGQLNHLSGADKVHLFNAVNLWIRNVVIRKRMEDLQLGIKKEVDARDEVHKFSDGTLTRILEKLDHMVKDFKLFKYNPGMESRICSEDDTKRSKYFMEVIKRQLKIRRILEVSKALSDTYTRNPIKEILLKLNLPDHMSVLTDSEVKVKMEMEMEIPHSSGVNFITTWSYLFDKSKDFMKAQVYV
ncbi:hypothetical protein Tco_0807626 [Tanacetum coccineum]